MSMWCRLLCAAIVAGPAVSVSQEQHDWTANQKTQALALVRVQKAPSGALIFSLRNVSGKAITAVALSSPPAGGSRSSVHRDYLDGSYTMQVTAASIEWKFNVGALADGATSDYQIGQAEAGSNTERVLNIDAVIFEDGSSDGSWREVRIMNAMRLGRVLETERIADLLAGADKGSPDIGALAQRVGGLPRSIDEALATLRETYDSELPPASFEGEDAGARQNGFVVGVARARETATQNLSEIARLGARAPAGIGSSLLSLKLAYEDRVKMYRSRGKQLFAKLPPRSLSQ